MKNQELEDLESYLKKYNKSLQRNIFDPAAQIFLNSVVRLQKARRHGRASSTRALQKAGW